MIWLYRVFTLLISPLIDVWFFTRILKGKEEWGRLKERLGQPQLARPQGKLVWIHGASVGEMLSVIPLIETLQKRRPNTNFLVTSGTRTSAKLAQNRLPKGAFHQYVPIDYALAVRNFMRHWQPDVSVFVESEFWPELLHQAHAPILINARMSDASYKKYKRFSGWSRFLLGHFALCLAQTKDDADRLTDLGAANVHVGGNLKYDAPPQPVDGEVLEQLQLAIETRPVLVAASTHEPEEKLVGAAHKVMQGDIPDLLTIIAPRHPHRGVLIQNELKEMGLKASRRSLGRLPTAEVDVYIADTIGEMGLWYTVGKVALVGGSFVSRGGQNPLEPIKAGTPTICGPHMENFRDMTKNLVARGALTQINAPSTLFDHDPKMMVAEVEDLLKHPEVYKEASEKLEGALASLEGATLKAADVINGLLQDMSEGPPHA